VESTSSCALNIVNRYDKRGFAGIIYLHDFSQNYSETDIRQDFELVRSIIGRGFYNKTILVFNKYQETSVQRFPLRRDVVRGVWHEALQNGTGEEVNPVPRGMPIPLIQGVLGRNADALLLASELKCGKKKGKMKLRNTEVGKAYEKQLKDEMQMIKGITALAHRREALKTELKRWQSCEATCASLLSRST
jgi:hypothetical protein